jgi:hypothetical protein
MLLEERILWEGVYLCVGVGKRGRHTSLAPLRNQQHQFNTSLLFLGIRTAASTATSVGKQRSSHMQHERRLQNTSTSHTAVPYPATCSSGHTSPQPAATRQAYFAAPPCQPPPRKPSSSLLFWILHARPFAPQHLAGPEASAKQHELITRRGIKITNFARWPAIACLELSWPLEPLEPLT